MRSRVQVVVLLCGLASTVALTVLDDAAAQAPSEIAAARQWFEEGLALEEQSRWPEALESFRRAAQVKKTAQILFHQGLCEKHVGLLVEAALSLSRSASLARKDSLPKVERAANTELSEVRERTPVLHVALPQGERPDQVTLDGEQLSDVFLSQPIPVNPGEHVIVVIAGGAESRKSVSVAESDSATVRFDALPKQGAPTTPSVAAPSTPSPAPSLSTPPPSQPASPPPGLDSASTGSGNVLGWSLVGGGVLAIAGGSLFWLQRNEQLSQIDDICPSRDQCPSSRSGDIDELESKGRTYSGVGLGLLGVGLTSATVGAVLLLGDSTEPQPRARLGPVWGPGVAGASFEGQF